MPDITMHLPDQWKSRKNVTRHLAGQLLNGRLSLFLGAGVSVPFGLPCWDELVSRLHKSTRLRPDKSVSIQRQVEIIREKRFPGKTKEFLAEVSRALYRNVDADPWKLRTNGTLAAIAALVGTSIRGHVGSVITFNYDDLLETLLEYYGLVVNGVFQENHWASNADVKVYHPHGHLPLRKGIQASADIVLDQASYSTVVGRDANSWRQEVVTILRTNTCLFVGLSGDDASLDSLIMDAAERHAITTSSSAYWGVTFLRRPSAGASALWRKRRIFPLSVKDYETDLPQFLFGITQEAARLRMSL